MVSTKAAHTRPKIIRILKLRVVDKPGYLGKIATTLGDLQANIGEISIINQGPDFLIREISLQLADEAHLAQVVEGLSELEGVKIEDVADPVQTLHEGGKIGIKSRIVLDSLAAMRQVYTPGVAQICRLIEQDKEKSRKYTSIAIQ